MSDNFLDEFNGMYIGENDLIKMLKEDKFKFTLNKRTRTASRWMMFKVNDELRSLGHDDRMRFHEKHVFSKLKIGSKEFIPSIDLQEERIIAVRIYN